MTIPPLIKKNRVALIVMLTLGLVFVVFLVLLGRVTAREKVVGGEYDTVRAELEKIISRGNSIPSEKLVEYLSEKKQLLEQKNEEVWKVLDVPETRMPEKVPDALGFKDTLMKTQERIYQLAAAKRVGMPLSLGFAGYEVVIPPEGSIPYLACQLKFTEDFLNLLLRSGVNQLQRMEFGIVDDVEVAELGGGTAYYREFHFDTEFIMPSAKLVGLIYQLRRFPYLLVVDKLTVNYASPGSEYSASGAPAPTAYSTRERPVTATMSMSFIIFLK